MADSMDREDACTPQVFRFRSAYMVLGMMYVLLGVLHLARGFPRAPLTFSGHPPEPAPSVNWADLAFGAAVLVFGLAFTVFQASRARVGFIKVDDQGITSRSALRGEHFHPWSEVTGIRMRAGPWRETCRVRAGRRTIVRCGHQMEDHEGLAATLLSHAQRHAHIEVRHGPAPLVALSNWRGAYFAAATVLLGGFIRWREAAIGTWQVVTLCSVFALVVDVLFRGFEGVRGSRLKDVLFPTHGAWLGVPLWLLGLIGLIVSVALRAATGWEAW